MSTEPPLTRDIGQAERTLQALLQHQLAPSNLTFPQWAVLTFLTGAGPLTQITLIDLLKKGKVVDSDEAKTLLNSMAASGLLCFTENRESADHEPRLSATEAGTSLYRPLREAVEQITLRLFADLPVGDLEATRRTLGAVTRRAERILESISS